MAHTYGVAGQKAFGMGNARHRRLIVNIVFPMLSLLVIVIAGYYAFLSKMTWVAVSCFIGYYCVLIWLEYQGMAQRRRALQAHVGEQAEQNVAAALRELPRDYHVFHDLTFKGFNVDHVVVGPNGIFLIESKSQQGKITTDGTVLKRNGMPFFQDCIRQCWRQTYNLRDHLHNNGAAGAFIIPVICFDRANVELDAPVKGIMVVNIGYLIRFILRQERKVNEHTRNNAITVLQTGVTRACHYSVHIPESADQDPAFRVCPKCGYERTQYDDLHCAQDECPQCGAYYESALAAVQAEAGPKDLQEILVEIFRINSLVSAFRKLLVPALGLSLAGILAWQYPVTDSPSVPGNLTVPVTAASNPEPGQMSADAAKPAEQNRTDASTKKPQQPELPLAPSVPNATAPVLAPSAPTPSVPIPPTIPKPQVSSSVEQPKEVEKENPNEGTLKVSAKAPTTVWFVDQHTKEKVGPFQIDAGRTREIVLTKGQYIVNIRQEGSFRQTSISFVSNRGSLDL